MVSSLIRVGVVALLVLVAGCAAVPGSDDGTPAGSTAAAGTPTAAGGSDALELAPGQYRPVVFEQPGRYVFRLATEYEADDGTVVFDVRSTSLSNTEIAVDLAFAGGELETTLSGNRIDITDGIQTLASGSDTIDADLRLYATVIEPGAWTLGLTLDVGAEWAATIDGVAGENAVDSTLTVTGTKTVGGVECYAVRGVADDDGRTVYEGCLAPGHGFPMQSIYYDSSGEVASLLELQSYESA